MIQKKPRSFLVSTLVATVIATFGVVPEARALTTLKQVQVTNGSQIDLLFDGKVSRNQVHTEFINDTIQISLSDSAVYPAKISSVSGGNIVKVFAYQYAPKLVRCRLSVRGKADSFKDVLQISPSGKMLTIRLGTEGKSVIQASQSAPVRKAVTQKHGDSENSDTGVNREDKALLDKVLSAGVPSEPVKAAAPAVAKPMAQAEATEKTSDKSGEKTESLGRAEHLDRPLAGGKALPSPLFAFGKLIIVLGIFGMLAIIVKRVMDRRGAQANSGVMGALGRFAQTKLGKPGKMIEVLSTHYLGPKKSIAVVRVGNRTLVLGVTHESINLITQLGPLGGESGSDLLEEELPSLDGGTGESNLSNGIFSNLLKNETSRPKMKATPAAPAPTNSMVASNAVLKGYSAQANPVSMQVDMDPIAAEIAPQTGVRSQIRSKLEGLKPL